MDMHSQFVQIGAVLLISTQDVFNFSGLREVCSFFIDKLEAGLCVAYIARCLMFMCFDLHGVVMIKRQA